MLRGLCGGRLYFVARERGLCPQASVWHAKEASVNLARWQQKTARQGEHRAGGPAALRTPCTRAHPVVGGRSILPATQYASTVRNTVAFGGPQCLRLSEFLMGSRQNFSDRFLRVISEVPPRPARRVSLETLIETWIYSITQPHPDVHRIHLHPHHTPLVNSLQHIHARN